MFLSLLDQLSNCTLMETVLLVDLPKYIFGLGVYFSINTVVYKIITTFGYDYGSSKNVVSGRIVQEYHNINSPYIVREIYGRININI